MRSGTKTRASTRRASFFTIVALAAGSAILGAVQQAPPAIAPSPQSEKPAAAEAVLLSESEISVTESGGIAGRVHSVRLAASSGRVEVEYRAREAPVSAPPFSGSLPTDRYVALWRELEFARIWDIASLKATAGADLIQTELRVRLGESTRVIRWDEGHQLTPEIRRLSEVARRVLAAGRESAFAR